MVYGAGAHVARRRRPEHAARRRRRRDAPRAQGRRVRESGPRSGVRPGEGPRGVGRDPRLVARGTEKESGPLDEGRRRYQRGDRRDDDRRSSTLRDDEGGHAALPRDQRQRLGDEVEVRQHLRLPPLGDRRLESRDRRDDRRQARRHLRLRRSRQGMRRSATRPGRARRDHGDRSDLRIAGVHGRLSSRDPRRCRLERRHLHHGDRQLRHHHRRAHGPDEGQGDRRQHRPLRQRDRHGRPEEGVRHQAREHQAAVRRVGFPRRPLGDDPC